jgi:uncharacterized protein (TIGR02246 family)
MPEDPNMRITTFTIAVSAFLSAMSAYPAPADELRAEIEAANATFSRHAAANDAAALAGLYTVDAAVIAPGAPIARGRAAIEAFWASTVAATKAVKLTTLAVESAGDLAMEEGEATLTGNDGKSTNARYVVVWKRAGGTWKLHRDIWN